MGKLQGNNEHCSSAPRQKVQYKDDGNRQRWTRCDKNSVDLDFIQSIAKILRQNRTIQFKFA